MKFNFEEVNFQELVKETADELKIVAEEKGLAITLKQPKSGIILKIDKQKIRQVIINFIDNSIKYSAAGTITIKTEVMIGDKLKEILKKTCQYGNVDLKIQSKEKHRAVSILLE